MFENLLYSVLKEQLSKYLENFQADNLQVGILGGNVEIVNVKLNKSIFDMFELPLEILFSSIGSIKLKVPWKNLMSRPIEAEVSNIYIIVSAKNPQDWDFKDKGEISRKLTMIDEMRESFIKRINEKQASKQGNSDQDEGMVKKMALKIIDNIQIKIENIHIRFEDRISGVYSWGIALNKFEVYTCDEQWNQAFIDRSLPVNKDKPLLKQLKLSNFGLYWIQKEQNLFHKTYLINGQVDKIPEQMKKMIIPVMINPEIHEFYSQFMILINFETKLYQNRKGDQIKPEISLLIDFDKINLHLENQQLQQIINLTELFAVYQSQLMEAKAQVKQINISVEIQLADKFETLFDQIQRSKTPKDPKLVLSVDSYKEYEMILMSVKMEVLQERMKKQVKQYQNEIAMELAAKEKQKKGKSGWFGWGKKPQEDSGLTNEELQNLQALVDEALQEECDVKLQENVNENYVWLDLNFTLNCGSFNVTKNLQNKREGVQLDFNNLIGQVQLKKNVTNVNVSLKSISVDFIVDSLTKDGKYDLTQRQKQQFLSPIIISEEDLFMVCQIEMTPLNNIDKIIKLKSRSLEFIYDPKVILRLQQFGDLKVDENLKSQAWDQIEQAHTAYQKNAEQKKLEQQKEKVQKYLALDIQCAAPVIIIPLRGGNFQEGPVWQMSLGELTVKTPEINQTIYDNYDIQLKDVSFKYFEQIGQCRSLIRKGILETYQYSLIQNFTINVKVQILRESNDINYSEPSIQVHGNLQALQFQLSPQIYEKILTIGDCFVQTEIQQEELQNVQRSYSREEVLSDRALLTKNAQNIQVIYMRGQTLKNWTKYTGVLKEGYIYLFSKPKDNEASSHIWVRNSDIIDFAPGELDMDNAFQIKNKYSDYIFATDKPELSKKWKDAIEKTRSIPRSKAKQIQQKEKVLERPMHFSFQVAGIELKLQDKQYTQWMSLDIQKLLIQTQIIGGVTNIQLGLKRLSMRDYVRKYDNEKLGNIITSDPINLISHEQQEIQNDLIVININQINEKDPNYKNVNLNVDVNFGTLQVVLKPLVIAQLINFINPVKEIQQIVILEKQEKSEVINNLSEGAQKQIVGFSTQRDITIIKVHVKIQSVQAILINRFTWLPIAQLSVQQTEIDFTQKSDEIILQSSLGNLQLLDLSNYPDTLSLESEWNKIIPVELIGVKAQQDSLLKIYFRGLNDGSPKIDQQTNIMSFVQVQMSKININLMMQPFMRLIDYILEQLLFSIQNPMKTICPDIDEKQVSIIKDISPQNIQQALESQILSEEEKLFLQKQLTKPPRMQLKVNIDTPQIILRPTQQSQEALIIDLGQISVENYQYNINDRVKNLKQLSEGVWVDNFKINLIDFRIYQFIEKQKNQIELTLPFNLNLSIELFGMAPMYELLYPGIEFDTQIRIKSYLSPIIIQLNHTDYVFIMKCLSHNISYDDGLDTMIREQNPQYFQAFFKQQKVQQERIQQMIDKQNESIGLSFQLDAENITAFLKTSTQPSIPFFKLTLAILRLKFTKYHNEKIDLTLIAQAMEGSVFTQSGVDEYTETPMLGNVSFIKKYNSEQMNKLQDLMQIQYEAQNEQSMIIQLASQGKLISLDQRGSVYSFNDVNTEQMKQDCQLRFEFTLNFDRSTIIMVDLNDFKLMVNSGPVFQILDVVANDSPNPSQGKFIKPSQKNNETVTVQNSEGSSQFLIGLKNVIIYVPTNVDNKVLAIRGEFRVQMTTIESKTLEKLKQELIIEKEIFNEIQKISIYLFGLEICICKANELSSKQRFQLINKREILKPLNITFMIQHILAPSVDFKSFIDQTIINTECSQVSLKICFKDIVLLKNGLDYQLNQIPQKQIEQNSPVSPLQQIEQDQIQKLLQMKQIVEQKINATILGMDIVILNDMGQTFTPILEFELYQIDTIVEVNNIFMTVGFNLPLRMSYFNPKVGCWEPVIEKTQFNIDLYVSNQVGGKLLTIEQHEDFPKLNINLSTMFFQQLFKAIYLLKQMTQPINFQTSLKLQEQEVYQKYQQFTSLSPYVVRNLTGYKIEINITQIQSLTLYNKQEGNLDFGQKDLQKQTTKNITVLVHINNIRKTLWIDMNAVKSKLITLGDGYQFFITVTIDQITNTKFLTISSHFKLINETNETLIVQFYDKSQQVVSQIDLKPASLDSIIDNEGSIPVGYNITQMSLRKSQNLLFSGEISLKDIDRNLPSDNQIQLHDKSFVLLNLSKNTEIQDVIEFRFQPPFKFTNSLPKPIEILIYSQQNQLIRQFQLPKGQSVEEYSLSLKQQNYFKVLVDGFDSSEDYIIQNIQRRTKQESQLILRDKDNQKLTLFVYEPWKKVDSPGCREFVFYCQSYLVNQSAFNIQIFTSNPKDIKKKSNVPGQFGQQKIILMGPECGELLSLKQTNNQIQSQNSVPTMDVGSFILDVIINQGQQQKLLYLSGNITIKRCNPKHLLFTKEISVDMRFLIINDSEFTLQLKNTNEQPTDSQPKSQDFLMLNYDPSSAKVDTTIINMKIKDAEYNWSGGIDINQIGVQYLQLTSPDKKKKVIFSIDIRQKNSRIILIIKQIPINQAPFKLTNKCSDIKLILLDLLLGPDESNYFAWNELSKKQNIQKLLISSIRNNFQTFEYDLNLDLNNLLQIITPQPKQGERVQYITISMQLQGNQKVIKVEPTYKEQMDKFMNAQKKQQIQKSYFEEEKSTKNKGSQISQQNIQNRINFKVNQIHLSVVHNSDSTKHPAEYLNFTLKNIETIYLQTNEKSIIQLRIQYLNLDNNSQLNVYFPVVVTPVKLKNKENSYFLNFIIEQDLKVKEIQLFKKIVFEIDSFVLKIEDQFISSIMDVINSISNFKNMIDDYEKKKNKDEQLMNSQQVQLGDKSQDLIDLNDLPPQALPIYIDNIIISPIDVELTFYSKSITSDIQTDNMALFKSIASTMGVVIKNIDEAPLNFTGLELSDCNDTIEGITDKIRQFYKIQAMRQVFKLLGSLSLLGNPLGLFNNIATGVQNLVERPVEGFAKGPLEGGLGLVEGAGSLVTLTVSGAFNSVNKITGSLGSGFASLSMDQDYLKKREQMRMKKPKQIGQGLQQAGKSVLIGFSEGITGLFTKPLEGVSNQGAIGFAKGLFQGGAGLIIKPVSGILDGVTKATEGIKNTASGFSGRPNEKRERPIRPFYGQYGYYTEFSDIDAEAISVVQKIEKGKYQNDRFISAYEVGNQINQLLVITVENIIYMNITEKKIICIVSINNYNKAELIQQGIIIRTYKGIQELKNKSEFIIEILKQDSKSKILHDLQVVKRIRDQELQSEI